MDGPGGSACRRPFASDAADGNRSDPYQTSRGRCASRRCGRHAPATCRSDAVPTPDGNSGSLPRELACGDWKRLPLVLGEKRPVQFYTPATGQTVEVRGVVRPISPAPRPGSVPYKDPILMIHLAEIESADDPSAAGKDAVVFAWSVRHNKAMPAGRFRPGHTVRLRLQSWSEVAPQYEAINRSGLDDDDLLLSDPAWAGDAGQEK